MSSFMIGFGHHKTFEKRFGINRFKEKILNIKDMEKEYDKWIRRCDTAICKNIDSSNLFDRGLLAVNILSQLRNLIDSVCVKIFAGSGGRLGQKYYDNITAAKKYVHGKGKYRFLKQFYDLLQISVSHYTLEPESSERLMLKHYEYLLRIKHLLMAEYDMEILHNINKFPLNTDPAFSIYHKAIADKIMNLDLANAFTEERRFYIYKIKPLFVDDSIYYEVTFSQANERTSKFDRLIAFTKMELEPNYAALLRLTTTEINVLGVKMPILIIVDWKVSIRTCELKNFGKILGIDYPDSRTKEYDNLMNYLTANRYSLVEIVNFDEAHFKNFLSEIQHGVKSKHISMLLGYCRNIIAMKKPGSTVLRYLLLRMNNKIIKSQYSPTSCSILGGLYLTTKAKPFDNMPFNFSLSNHNPLLSDLLDAIPVHGHESELLARRLTINAEHNGTIYTPLEELSAFPDVMSLVKDYNNRLYYKHQHARIETFKNFLYVRQYEENVHLILQILSEKTKKGIANYAAIAGKWLESPGVSVDSEEKRTAILNLFSDSQVAFVFGAAGTGKSTLINHISNVFGDKDKLYIANTNPAVDNLRRKVNAANTNFMTITGFLSRNVESDILFIDECSTVSNEDMLEILKKRSARLLVLVGDMFQIESIKFGNWFSISYFHFKGSYVVELTQPYRTSCPELINTWEKIRTLSPDILEYLTRNDYSAKLDESIFTKVEPDEIILCLNYGGLYGINNINRFLQSNNPNPPIRWGIHIYKVGDPILFNEMDRYMPILYNNLKGEIVNISTTSHSIFFTLKVYTVLSDFDLEGTDIEYVSQGENGTTIIRIEVEEEEDEDSDINTDRGIIPFQIAYAVSIHKAQGLEYQSVKIVITHDVEDLITHNIFYTAVTRTRERLKIYWTPESENKILKNMKIQFSKKDYGIIKNKYHDF